MRVLLDTHAFLWAASEPDRLTRAVRACFEAGDPPLVSAASVWEIVVKVQKGKLTIESPAEMILKAISDLGVELLPVRLDHVLGVFRLQPHHKDPFDRLLVAQAITEGLAFATKDEDIRRYPVDIVW